MKAMKVIIYSQSKLNTRNDVSLKQEARSLLSSQD